MKVILKPAGTSIVRSGLLKLKRGIMIKYICNEKGGGEILSFLVVLPITLMLVSYVIFGGLFLIEVNELSTIVNKKMDMAAVEGQFTIDIKNGLINELDDKGYKKEKLIIEISPAAAADNNDSAYVKRGQEISIKVVYEQAHPFYYINLGLAEEKTFYPKTRVTGMSEKW